MIRFTARTSWKKSKIAARVKGTLITLRWRDWPAGKPAVDPTTGSVAPTEEQPAVESSLQFRAMVHFVQPTMGTIRLHAEIQVGDAIVDVNVKFYRVTDAGETDLEVGSVYNEYDVMDAERTAGSSVLKEEVFVHTLENSVFEIDGRIYRQKKVGDALAKSWGAIVSDIGMFNAIALELQI